MSGRKCCPAERRSSSPFLRTKIRTTRKLCCNRWKRASGKSSSTAAATPDTPPSGHLVYIRNGTLLAVPFDLKRLETSGPPVPVLEGV